MLASASELSETLFLPGVIAVPARCSLTRKLDQESGSAVVAIIAAAELRSLAAACHREGPRRQRCVEEHDEATRAAAAPAGVARAAAAVAAIAAGRGDGAVVRQGL